MEDDATIQQTRRKILISTQVAAVLKARAAAKKKGKPVSAAAQAALANAKARPAQKKKAPKGRVVADPGCNGY